MMNRMETQTQGCRQPSSQGQNKVNIVRHRGSLPFIENGRQRILPSARLSEAVGIQESLIAPPLSSARVARRGG